MHSSSALRSTFVERAKLCLATRQSAISTVDLLDLVAGDDRDTRKQAAAMLLDAAKYELAEYATQGDPVPGKGYNAGKLVRPWLWHAPKTDRAPVVKTPNQLDQIVSGLAEIKMMLNKLLTNGQ